MSNKDDLKTYLKKCAHFRRIIPAIPMLLFGIAGILNTDGPMKIVPFIPVSQLTGFVLILSAIISTKDDREQLDAVLNKMEENCTLVFILQDFDKAQTFLADTVSFV